MDIPDKHYLKIARSTMKLHCLGAKIMGGMNHIQAIEVIKRLTGKNTPKSTDCTCEKIERLNRWI